MSPFFNVGSLRKSPIVNRIRSIYTENATDAALDTLRMQSVSISHIRDLSSGLKSSSSDSSEDELETCPRIDLKNRKRFHERRLLKSRSESAESVTLQRNNTFSEYGKRKEYDDEVSKSPVDSFESPNESDTEFKTPMGTQEDFSPLNLLLNYRSGDDTFEEQKNLTSTLDSYKSIESTQLSPSNGMSPQRFFVKSEPVNGTRVTSDKYLNPIEGEAENLNYSLNKTSYVFRLCFEPKLSVVKDTSYVPSRIIINKSPFVIGSDASCDLVLPKRKFKFIAPRHCKVMYQPCFINSSDGSVNDENPVNNNHDDEITSYLVKIAKCSSNGTTYLNNNLLRGNLYLENGDLVSLGPKNNYLTFRAIFQTKKECQLLKTQLTSNSSNNENLESNSVKGGEPQKTNTDNKVVVVDEIKVMGVKIFIFQVFNGTFGDSTQDSSLELDQNFNHDYSHNLTNGQAQDFAENEKDYQQAGGRDLTPQRNFSYEELSEMNSQSLDDSGYYKLKSPIRNYGVIKSPSSQNEDKEVFMKNLDNYQNEALLELYSSSERPTQDALTTNPNPETEKNDTEKGMEDLNSFIQDNLTQDNLVQDNDEESDSCESTQIGGKIRYKLIGILDATNNMNVSELLPNINRLVRNEIDQNLHDFQVLKKFNTPMEREILNSSWVFQLEFLDSDNPKVRRAILRHKMFQEGEEKLEKVLKDNKCRVIYIKTE